MMLNNQKWKQEGQCRLYMKALPQDGTVMNEIAWIRDLFLGDRKELEEKKKKGA